MEKAILIIKTPTSYPSDKVQEFGTAMEQNDEIKKDYDLFVLPNIEDVWDFRIFNNKYGEEAYDKLKKLIDKLKQ